MLLEDWIRVGVCAGSLGVFFGLWVIARAIHRGPSRGIKLDDDSNERG